jgi:hypothetical protein
MYTVEVWARQLEGEGDGPMEWEEGRVGGGGGACMSQGRVCGRSGRHTAK